MNMKLIELAERRTSLVARSAAQRTELSQALASWRGAVTVVEYGLGAASFIRRNAPLLVGVAAFLAPLRPWRMAKWLQRAWMVWSMARLVKGILRGF